LIFKASSLAVFIIAR